MERLFVPAQVDTDGNNAATNRMRGMEVWGVNMGVLSYVGLS